MTDCNSNIVTWHNVCDPYNYEATFSSASATIYLNGLCVYEGVIVEGNTYPIINLNIGVNEVRIVYGSSCVIFYIETYYEVGEEIAFNSSTLLLQEEEVCDPCGTNVPSIPFATLLLNGDEFLEVFINTITDIILIYENGTEVVPLSVVDNVITLNNPGEGGDATYDLEDENGNAISSGSIVCGENEIIVAPNALINIRDSATLIMYALDLLSNSSTNQVITDSVATLKDTANNTLSTTNIVAQGSANITAPDATLTLNGGAWTSKRSGSTNDIDLVFVNGSDVPTVSLTGTTITIANLIQETDILAVFPIGSTETPVTTVIAGLIGTYTANTQDGASGTITYKVNGVLTSLPFALVLSDTIQIFRTVSTAAGWVNIDGTY